MPIPSWAAHSTSFCIGAITAVVGIALQNRPAAASTGASGSRVHEDDKFQHGEHRTQPAMHVQTSAQSSFTSINMLPTLPIRLFRPNDNLLIAFDTRNKNPVFVVERLLPNNKHSSGAAIRKNKRFYEESTLAPYHRSRNHHYRNSGYDRGHLAPAADFPFNDDEMNDTFALTNASPQMPRFNRTMWLRLEEFVRSVAEKESAAVKRDNTASNEEKEVETWVISGPLWLPSSISKTPLGEDGFRYSYAGIGKPPSLVSVPTHFFKVVVVVSKTYKMKRAGNGESVDMDDMVMKKFAAFVLPNTEQEVPKFQLANYLVRLTDLEAVTGLEIFPAILGSYDNKRESGKSDDALPICKQIADALTDDVRLHAISKGRLMQYGSTNQNESALVPVIFTASELSKGRQRKIQQILRDNSPIGFAHLCSKNDECFKMFNT